MKLICEKCQIIPLIKIFLYKEDSLIIVVKCKCGKKFHDLTSFIVDYTDLIPEEAENNITEQNFKKIDNDNKLLCFCETCFENLNKDSLVDHIGHQLIKIGYDKIIISDEELETISDRLKSAEKKIREYLPNLREMLSNDCKDENEKRNIENIAKNNIFKNTYVYKLVKLFYDIYIFHKTNNSINYQMWKNVQENCDFNLNIYNLDLEHICKEKFFSFLKSSLIICCNHKINKVFSNYFKEKEQLKQMILNLKPLEDTSSKDEPIFVDEMIKSNNSIYYGEKSKINNLAYGRGFLYCASGSHYLGYFKDDFFQSGLGVSVNSNKNIYIGKYKDGIANGLGIYKTKTGNVYKGYWTNNKLNGFGYIKWSSGKYYKGEIINGAFDGYGEFCYNGGNLYRGKFKNGKMDGIGSIIYKNQKKYFGEFKEGYKSGYGIMEWIGDEKYEGTWEKDEFKFGEYFWPNGNIYFGNFKNDSINGFGTFYNSYLNKFETGIFKEGRRLNITDSDSIPNIRYLSFL